MLAELIPGAKPSSQWKTFSMLPSAISVDVEEIDEGNRVHEIWVAG